MEPKITVRCRACGVRLSGIPLVAAVYNRRFFGVGTARTRPEIPFCLVKDRRFLSVRLLDRNRKRAMCVVLEEHIIEEGMLNDSEQLVHHWLREAKTNEEIGLILKMKTATVKKHVARILEKLGVENRTAAALCSREFPK
jgi:DNA-binding CsgD family transcriptional regulator